MVIAIFGDKAKRSDRLIGSGIAIVAWVVFVAIIIAAGTASTKDDGAAVISSGKPTKAAVSAGEATKEPELESTKEPEKPKPDILHLAIGETAKIGDAEVTVMGVRTQTSGDLLSPDPGNEWIIVDVLIKNTGDDAYNLSSLLQTDMRDDSGRTHDLTLFADTQGTLDGTIPPGDILRGEGAFEVPTSATGVQFVFKQSFGDQQARWNVR